MSTTLAKAGKVERKWYVIDAAGKPLGRVAATAAVLLRGKNKVTFTPNVDCGDHVVIINTDKAVLTGSKMEKKYYYHHSGWIGGMKATQYRTLGFRHEGSRPRHAARQHAGRRCPEAPARLQGCRAQQRGPEAGSLYTVTGGN